MTNERTTPIHTKKIAVLLSCLVIVSMITISINRGISRYFYGMNKTTSSFPDEVLVGAAKEDLLDQTLIDIWEPFDKTRNVPYYWAIPKTGSRSALAYLRICLQLCEASHKGEQYSKNNKLEVISHGNLRFVNVNLMSPEGMKRAVQLNLISSGLMDFVTSDNMYHTMAKVFLPSSSLPKARLFTLFRHPVEREVSRFYFMQYATWERRYDPNLKEITLEQFIQSGKVYDNWMVRSITGKTLHDDVLTTEHLTEAKEVLRRKCLVGLSAQMEESMERFQSFFEWKLIGVKKNESPGGKGGSLSGEACKEKFLVSENGRLNKNKGNTSTLDEDSDLWKELANIHRFDVKLYTYAVSLFEEQAPLYTKINDQQKI